MRKTKYHIFIASFTYILFFILCPSIVVAQGKKVKDKEKTIQIEVNATIVSSKGEAVHNAEIIVGEGALIFHSDINGNFNIKVKSGSKFIIEAIGYESKVVDVSHSIKKGSKIILTESPLFAGTKDILELPGGIQTKRRFLLGSVSTIEGNQLESFPVMGLGNSLQGKLTGLMVDINTGGGLGTNNASLYIRGLHRGSNDGVVTIVDGVERGISTLIPEELASLEVLKDPISKLLYGPRAANGILLITTKKGQEYKRIIKSNVEYGVGLVASNYPQYLNSYDYARLYNEARLNDGLTAVYSNADLAGYKNSSGPNDFRYPNLDYYNYFMNNSNQFKKATFEFSGGNEGARYAFIGGYTSQDGLEKIGRERQRNKFNARGNLSMKINDIISASIGMGLVFDLNNQGSLSTTDVMSALSTHRPNEYPIFIPESVVAADSVGYPVLGASNTVFDNLYSSLMYGGFQKEQTITGQLNLCLNFDFNSFVKGLAGKVQLTFDNDFYGLESLSTTASTYSQRWVKTTDGRDSVIMIQRKQSNKNDLITLSNGYTSRTTSILGSLNYVRDLNKSNHLSIDYVYNYYINENTGITQDNKFLNNVLRVNYINNQKYILDGSIGYMGDNKFSGNNRYATSYAMGLGWIISNENFLTSVKQIDFLKFKTSIGLLPYDAQTPYNLYENSWNSTGTARINYSLNPTRTNFNQIGNPDLKWEKSREFNLGIEMLTLRKRLKIEANYFNEYRYDMIQQVSSLYSQMFGGIYPYTNWGQLLNQGVEAEFKYSDRTGEVSYSLGTNIIYSKNKILQTDQINNPDEYLNKIGQPSDAMYGYVAKGLFGRDVDLSTATPQTLGTYGIGDIAYEDLNGDGLITELDQKIIGNSFPRIHLGVDLNLDYKGFGLYVLGTAQLGYYNWQNSSYYWISGEDKYSVVALDRYHPINNPDGKYPRLTTTNGSNNYRNSTFWLEKADFFKIKNVELSYTFNDTFNSGIYKKIKLFVRGTNLLCFSQVKDHDPEATNAGLTTYPVLKNITGGLSVIF